MSYGKTSWLGVAATTVLCALASCTTAPSSTQEQFALNREVMVTINRFRTEDPSLKAWFESAAGYAVFPEIGRGGAGIGGAYGHGAVYQKGVPVGYCDVSQGTIGLQLGGQTFSEVIFFENPGVLQQFKENRFAFTAEATAVALRSGAAANAKYADGVAVFTQTDAGLMFEAALGGQMFNYDGQ